MLTFICAHLLPNDDFQKKVHEFVLNSHAVPFYILIICAENLTSISAFKLANIICNPKMLLVFSRASGGVGSKCYIWIERANRSTHCGEEKIIKFPTRSNWLWIEHNRWMNKIFSYFVFLFFFRIVQCAASVSWARILRIAFFPSHFSVTAR